MIGYSGEDVQEAVGNVELESKGRKWDLEVTTEVMEIDTLAKGREKRAES